MIPVIATPRLVLRPLELSDSGPIQALFPRWEVVKFMTAKVPWPFPDDGALTYLRDAALPAMREGREWHWSIRPRTESGRLIGVISLMDNDDDNRGFWLDPAWWNRGMVTEASAAVTDYWFGPLERPVLRTSKAAANQASRRISERSGMRLVGTGERDYVCGRLPREVWEITAEAWRARLIPPAPAAAST